MENKKFKLKFSKEDFDINKIKNSVFEFFLNHSEILFMIFFVGIASFSGFLIYRYIYFSSWSEERKKTYLLEVKKGEVDFNLNEFNAIIEKVKERDAAYSEDDVVEVRDIFGVKK
ncbi:MAG: hypothetical protein WC682_03620 [Parcubacteria group bacterium]|jgi:hypothetical protein